MRIAALVTGAVVGLALFAQPGARGQLVTRTISTPMVPSSAWTTGLILEGASPSASSTFQVDHVRSLRVELASSRSDLIIRIVRSGGLPDVTEANAASIGGSYSKNIVPPRAGEPDSGGTGYRFSLPKSAVPAGTYTLVVESPVGLTQQEPVVATIRYRSELGAAIAIDGQLTVVGRPAVVSVAVIEGQQPVTGATVQLSTIGPADAQGNLPPAQNVTLLDNGQVPDGVANDGLYTGVYTPQVAGTHSLMAKVTGQSTGQAGLPGGLPATSVAFQRMIGETIDVQPQRVRFATRAPIVLTETVADRDGDGFFERLDVSTDLEIREPGVYDVSLILNTRSGKGIFVSGRLDASDVPSIPAGSPPVVRTVTASVADWSLLAALPPAEWNEPTDPNDPDEAKTYTLTLRRAEVRYRSNNGDTLMDEVAPSVETPVTLATRRVYDIDRNIVRPLPDGPVNIVPLRDGNDKIVGIQITLSFTSTLGGIHTFSGRMVNRCGVPLGEVSSAVNMLPETPAEPIRTNTFTMLFDTTMRVGPMGEAGPFSMINFAIATPHGVVRALGGPVLHTLAFPAADFLNHHPFPDFNHNGITDYCDIFIRRDTDNNNNNRADSGEGGCNPSDIAQSDGSAGPDGSIDNGDFQAFFGSFFNGCTNPGAYPCALADIANSAGEHEPPGSPATPDGQVDNGDFSLFFATFFVGCP